MSFCVQSGSARAALSGRLTECRRALRKGFWRLWWQQLLRPRALLVARTVWVKRARGGPTSPETAVRHYWLTICASVRRDHNAKTGTMCVV